MMPKSGDCGCVRWHVIMLKETIPVLSACKSWTGANDLQGEVCRQMKGSKLKISHIVTEPLTPRTAPCWPAGSVASWGFVHRQKHQSEAVGTAILPTWLHICSHPESSGGVPKLRLGEEPCVVRWAMTPKLTIGSRIPLNTGNIALSGHWWGRGMPISRYNACQRTVSQIVKGTQCRMLETGECKNPNLVFISKMEWPISQACPSLFDMSAYAYMLCRISAELLLVFEWCCHSETSCAVHYYIKCAVQTSGGQNNTNTSEMTQNLY